MGKVLPTVCVLLLFLGAFTQSAEAKRLGAGFAKGVQRESVTPRHVTPQPTAPTQQVIPHPATPSPTPTAPTDKRSWFGPLAGLAAGAGMGALLALFGTGEGGGSWLIILLLAVAVLGGWQFFMRTKRHVVLENDSTRSGLR